ncbi:MAG: hypothetical protein GX860_11520, partial [Alcaligenaceae bacterium]|nr:hypothetical protein [Alcaligenaceae bacterium]
MDSREREARDHRFEEFVLDQVRKYGDMESKVSKVYIGCVIACIVMCVFGIVLGKSFSGSLFVGLWSLGFMAAAKYYESDAKLIEEKAVQIRAAIDAPDFDIPDDYPEDILNLRQLVCPTLKNVRSQMIAYGIIALACWGGAVVILAVSMLDGFSAVIFIAGLVMGGMALMLTFLAVRAAKDIPIAKAY